jgi:hypothetical protein
MNQLCKPRSLCHISSSLPPPPSNSGSNSMSSARTHACTHPGRQQQQQQQQQQQRTTCFFRLSMVVLMSAISASYFACSAGGSPARGSPDLTLSPPSTRAAVVAFVDDDLFVGRVSTKRGHDSNKKMCVPENYLLSTRALS